MIGPLDVPARDLVVVASSGTFDADFYRSRNPDVVEADADPLLHFLAQGWREGRDPCADFSLAWYATTYDVPADVNPFVHYLDGGWQSGALPCESFSVEAPESWRALAPDTSPLAMRRSAVASNAEAVSSNAESAA